jgi:excisionase family DNA binding protein
VTAATTWCTAREAAKRLGLSRARVHQLIGMTRLHGVLLGGRWLLRIDAVEMLAGTRAWIAANRADIHLLKTPVRRDPALRDCLKET